MMWARADVAKICSGRRQMDNVQWTKNKESRRRRKRRREDVEKEQKKRHAHIYPYKKK